MKINYSPKHSNNNETSRSHNASCVLMVSPVHLQFNEQTAIDNEYQQKPLLSLENIRSKALFEFYNMVEKLQLLGVEVIVIAPNTDGDIKPDAIFPNNCFSTTVLGDLYLYPMYTNNRQDEVKLTTLINSFAQAEKKVIQVHDIKDDIIKGEALEGTGSLIFDHVNHQVFVGISQRSNKRLVDKFIERSGHQLISFSTCTSNNVPVYHTNVMLSIGEEFAVVCQAVIENKDQEKVLMQLEKNKEVIVITEKQMQCFCANILQLKNQQGEKFIVMSTSAFSAFSEKQKAQLSKYGQLVPFDISTIESIGGGSVRCMLAEIFLPTN